MPLLTTLLVFQFPQPILSVIYQIVISAPVITHVPSVWLVIPWLIMFVLLYVLYKTVRLVQIIWTVKLVLMGSIWVKINVWMPPINHKPHALLILEPLVVHAPFTVVRPAQLATLSTRWLVHVAQPLLTTLPTVPSTPPHGLPPVPPPLLAQPATLVHFHWPFMAQYLNVCNFLAVLLTVLIVIRQEYVWFVTKAILIPMVVVLLILCQQHVLYHIVPVAASPMYVLLVWMAIFCTTANVCVNSRIV